MSTVPTVHTVATYEGARDAFRQKQLRQALYDAGEVVMADVLVNLHGDAHRSRRRAGEPALPPRHPGAGRADPVPGDRRRDARPARRRGRAELVSLSHEMMMNLAATAPASTAPSAPPRRPTGSTGT